MLTIPIDPPRRILVLRLMHHGDVLLATPVFVELKRLFPNAEVDALVYAETAPMIAANPDLNRIWSLFRSKDGGRGWARLHGMWRLMWQIRKRRYDWVMHMNDQWVGALAALASGAKLRVSYDLPKRDNLLWRSIFPLRLPVMLRGHVVERNLAFLRELGFGVDIRAGHCRMVFSDTDRELACRTLVAAGVVGEYVLVHPTARWFFKCWEDDRFAEVLRSLASEGYRIVLTSGPESSELALIDHLLELAPHPNIVSLAGQLTLPALAAAISAARLFVGVDSVPMHMAAALDVPLVALFGPTNVEAWRPWSKKAVVIHAADYGPLIAPKDVDTTTNKRYLSNIPVAPVLEAVRLQLSSR